MRIRTGADFLEASIRTHIAFYDEIVAVHNQCTDATSDILARLARAFVDSKQWLGNARDLALGEAFPHGGQPLIGALGVKRCCSLPSG